MEPDHPGDPGWKIAGSGDFNQDGHDDLAFQHLDGTIAVWLMKTTRLYEAGLFDPANPDDPDWRVATVIDLNGDGNSDLVFQHAQTNRLGVWLMNRLHMISGRLLTPSHPGGTWQLRVP